MPPSRRDFAKLTALGLAAHYFPNSIAQTQTPENRRIGYAVIGLGRIATHFLAGAAQSLLPRRIHHRNPRCIPSLNLTRKEASFP